MSADAARAAVTPTAVQPTAVKPTPLEPLARALRSGELTLGRYLDEALERIAAHEGVIKALLPEPGRARRLRAEAAALEARWPVPAERPPLYGILLGVKDIFAAEGFRTKAGSRLPEALFDMPEGPVVAALRAAGALVLGKTVTTEFAYFAPGPTTNPWDPTRTPGGSSSGSAAALAAGFCSLALGTQTIGSISRPAAFCGVAGWKPSRERLSRAGVVPFSPSLDHVGLLAPDVAGIALAASVAAPGWDGLALDEAYARLGRMRPVLAVPEGPYLGQASEQALAAFERTVSRLSRAGFPIVRVAAMDDIDDINERHRRIAAAEMERSHRQWYAAHESLCAEATRTLMRRGRDIDDNRLELDLMGRASLRQRLEESLAEAGAAYWISPAATGPAPSGLSSTGDPAMNLPWTHAGLPTLALPSGESLEGMPLGLQIAAATGTDERLLALGARLEAILGA